MVREYLGRDAKGKRQLDENRSGCCTAGVLLGALLWHGCVWADSHPIIVVVGDGEQPSPLTQHSKILVLCPSRFAVRGMGYRRRGLCDSIELCQGHMNNRRSLTMIATDQGQLF